MKYKIMVIDDQRQSRERAYKAVLPAETFDTVYIWTRREFAEKKATPVDCYIIDVFLDTGDWENTDAAELLNSFVKDSPRPAPIFFISEKWGDERVLDFLKRMVTFRVDVMHFLAWSEFSRASASDDGAEQRMNSLQKKLLFELDRWHGRSNLKLEDSESIKILVLADLQFGDSKTDPEATFAEQQIAHALKQEHMVPDLIALAGDISYSGNPEEYQLAETRLKEDLIGPLWGDDSIERNRDKIILVPGNHDVNLRFSACDKYKYDFKKQTLDAIPLISSPKSHHEYALEPFRRFAFQMTGDNNWKTSPQMSWIDRRFEHLGIRFFILNSVHDLNADNPDYASFSEDALRRINRSILGSNHSPFFSIAVSHHGLRPADAQNNVKFIEKWCEANKSFSMNNISLWLFGHFHNIFDSQVHNEEPFKQSPLWCIQAPSVRIRDGGIRGFYVLELKRKDGKVADAFVHPFSFTQKKVVKGDTSRVYDKG